MRNKEVEQRLEAALAGASRFDVVNDCNRMEGTDDPILAVEIEHGRRALRCTRSGKESSHDKILLHCYKHAVEGAPADAERDMLAYIEAQKKRAVAWFEQPVAVELEAGILGVSLICATADDAP